MGMIKPYYQQEKSMAKIVVVNDLERKYGWAFFIVLFGNALHGYFYLNNRDDQHVLPMTFQAMSLYTESKANALLSVQQSLPHEAMRTTTPQPTQSRISKSTHTQPDHNHDDHNNTKGLFHHKPL